ncbi:unnamed protein product [Ceutorhynchus assimilis]|uniref:Peptidase S1 domain-containing protein n=1 Tax=Ceutorhynchus assimilis TaxID=467358 RepID=A0A9N9QCT7_9CUCU|nr:unnamed protein product [Ceutorhynchus assimilis]
MKLVIVFVACCLIGASAAADEENKSIDWHHIQPLGIHVEPIGPAPVYTGIRIAGGSIAPPNSFPYQVALIISNAGFCGGSIISKDWVLTAAHCVESNNPVQVIAGAHNPSATEPSQVRIAAESCVVHPGWDLTRLENDIAVLNVPNIPIGTQTIDSIRLAPSNSGSFAGAIAALSGWGKTSDSTSSPAIASELRNVTLSIITNQVCQSSFGSYVRETNICTSGAGPKGACDGDSGGPLVVDGAVVGVVSFGSMDCEDGAPSAYARVSSYTDWIQQHTGI